MPSYAGSSTCLSLIYLVVELVKNLAEHGFDVVNIAMVFVFGKISCWHFTHVIIKPINRLGDVVKHPAAEKRSQTNDDVKQHL